LTDFDRDRSTPAPNDISRLEICQEFVGGLAGYAEHVREMLLRHGQAGRAGAVLERKKPTCTVLLNGQNPIFPTGDAA
jgi:hypothetical protein